LDGLTGKIRFDQRGRRESFGLDLMELTIDGIKQVRVPAITFPAALWPIRFLDQEVIPYRYSSFYSSSFCWGDIFEKA